MAPKCKICNHQDREKIDRMILSGVSNRAIASQYNEFSIGSVQRHKAHIPTALAEAKHADEVTQADNLIDDLEHLRETALSFLHQAKQANDLRVAAGLIGAAVKVIETLAEVRGELDRKATVNIIFSPAWIETRTVILTALEAYPDARLAVSQALQEMTE